MNSGKGYYDLFLRTCAKNPSGLAVINFEDEKYKRYTYSELYGVCEYISQVLQQLGCNKGIIGLVTERNVIIPAVIAAAHKCYSTFMFISPKQNVEEINDYVKLNAVILIEQNEANIRLFNREADRVSKLFGLFVSFYSLKRTNSVNSLHSKTNRFFITQTSGSTGEPKHIKVPIQCLQPNIDDFSKMFKVTSSDIIYFSTPLTFDPSMVEILLACTNGAALLIAPENAQILFPKNKENAITIWQTTPSKFFQQPYLDIKNNVLSKCSTLRVLALGGEPLSGVRRLKELKDKENRTKIFTLYGVTEMSCWACAAELDLSKAITDREVPLGVCLSETQLTIQPTSASNKSQGKIMLSSDSRRCILLKKSKKEKDVILKKVDTGDMAEIRNKTFYFMGRKDDIIKRFGHKINLNVIESVAMQCPKVKTCSCVWLPKPFLLVVYFASDDFSTQDLTNFLKCKLDEKHWPDKIIHVENIPTNQHGKTTRQNTYNECEKQSKLPSIDVIRILFLKEANMYLSLKYEYESIKDKYFFAIGGTSFQAISLCNNLSQSIPQFGKFLLPYLMSQKYNLDDAISRGYNDFCTKNKPKVMIKRSRAEIDSNGEVMIKKVYLNPIEDMEFVEIWSHNTGKCVDATPTLYRNNQSLYTMVGSHSGRVLVVDALSGTMIGTVTLNSRIEASVLCFTDEATSLPCGVVGSYNGTIVCFNITTCQEIWKQNIESMIKSKAVCCNGLIYIASYDGRVRCLDIKNGDIKHVIEVTDQAISADLVLAKEKFVLVGALSGLCACISTASNAEVWCGMLGSPVFGAPALYDNDKYVIFAEVAGVIHCRTVESGIEIWKFDNTKGNVFSSIHINELDQHRWQLLFGCHDDHLYSLLVTNSQPILQWKKKLLSPVYSTPHLYNSEIVIAASNNGTLYALDLENGTIITQYKLPNEVFSSPVVYENYVFVGCRNDNFIGFKFVMHQ